MILIFKYIFPKRYVGLTLWPIIILKENNLRQDEVLINHERIHLKQQLELLIIPFYIWYTFEWIIGIIKFRNFNEAYRNISFEKEAYQNERNLNYLNKRSIWGFLHYLK
ncbi:hypothetical protein JM658_04145 [Joostella atrarenae]|uniref:Peptidase M56 domain-containing protein n=1 Tax=Joostella atrarenae TaxID=679257 RepID=A0ABS9J0Q2_9FLAO|nr:hypothetical protein [Joostella atrarenae]MCF8714010.1 hypothetical protein [Joostella atrarenae]